MFQIRTLRGCWGATRACCGAALRICLTDLAHDRCSSTTGRPTVNRTGSLFRVAFEGQSMVWRGSRERKIASPRSVALAADAPARLPAGACRKAGSTPRPTWRCTDGPTDAPRLSEALGRKHSARGAEVRRRGFKLANGSLCPSQTSSGYGVVPLAPHSRGLCFLPISMRQLPIFAGL